MRSFYAVALFFALAGRAIALNIVFGGKLGNITASQLLAIPEGQLKANCDPRCNPAVTAIQTCGNNDDRCLCDNATIAAIVTCEQCMLSDLIARNQPMPDPRAGSNPGLGAYVAACESALNMTIPKSTVTLTLPSNWDGPQSLPLSTGVTAVYLIAGGVLSVGSLLIMSNL